MSSLVDRLPSRFPVGTRYVIEGRAGAEGGLRIHLRYLEFWPSGGTAERHRAANPFAPPPAAPQHPVAKIIALPGTTRALVALDV